MEMEAANKPEPPFECKMCNQCCHGKGGIYLEEDQLGPAAAELGLTLEEFSARHCMPAGEGRFEIAVDQTGACSLLTPKGCSIHKTKPAVCRLWPFFPGLLKDAGAFEEAKLICPGIRPDASHEEFVAFAQAELQKQTTG